MISDEVGGSPSVLVVDDDQDIADTYSLWLKGGYDVETAYGGHDALQLVDGSTDVMLLDRRMPDIDGDEVLRQVREKGLECQVSMLTALKPDSGIDDLPFDEYLTKPVTKTELVQTLEELLLRGDLSEETQDYLALKSTVDALRSGVGAEEIDRETVGLLTEQVESAGSYPDVRRETDELEQLTHINDIMRSVNAAVVDSDSIEVLEDELVNQFSQNLPYEHAVFGEYTDNHDEFLPTASTSEELPGSVTCPPEDPISTALTGQTVAVDSPGDEVNEGLGQLRSSIADGLALDSAVIVPVVHRENVQGGILLFADREVSLSDRERSTLLQAGHAVGSARDMLKAREIVASDSIVKLGLDIRDEKDVFVELSAQLDCHVHLDGMYMTSKDGILCYVTVSGGSSEEVTSFLAESSSVVNCRVVDSRGNDLLLQCTLSGPSILSRVMETAAGVREFSVEEGVGSLSAEFPPDANLRTILAAVKEDFEEVELVSKQHTESSFQSEGRFRGKLEEKLTERQDEVFSAAFHGGYFDWPRGSTAEEIAEVMHLAPPTLHEHLRGAERKLAESYLEETDSTRSLTDE